MTTYTVRWEITVEADSPRAAAEEAEAAQAYQCRDPLNGGVFLVYPGYYQPQPGPEGSVWIDLEALRLEELGDNDNQEES